MWHGKSIFANVFDKLIKYLTIKNSCTSLSTIPWTLDQDFFGFLNEIDDILVEMVVKVSHFLWKRADRSLGQKEFSSGGKRMPNSISQPLLRSGNTAGTIRERSKQKFERERETWGVILSELGGCPWQCNLFGRDVNSIGRVFEFFLPILYKLSVL